MSDSENTTPENPQQKGERSFYWQGERNKRLFQLGCLWRRQGFNQSDIEEELLPFNEERCAPPLTKQEVQRIASNACRYAAGDGKTSVFRASWPRPLGEAAFHGVAGEIVRVVEPQTEADPAAVLMQLLVAFGNAVGRGPHFTAEADRHALNLFNVLVGETAKGRKGSSWGYIPRIFEVAQLRDGLGINVNNGLSSGEGLIWAVRDPLPQNEDPGVEDKRLIVFEAEFASTLRVMERDGNTLSPVIRNAWDTGNLASLTKNSPARATGAHLSIIGHVTRNELLRELNRTELGNGFANRFLWTCVRRSKQLPEGGQIPNEALQPLAEGLAEAVRFGQGVGEMKRDEEARGLWHQVYGPLSEGKPGLFGAVIARAEAQVMRLACISALLDRSQVIRRPHLEAALEVWRYAEDSARFIFGDALGDPVADEILRALHNAGSAGLTRTQIRDLFGRNRSGATYGQALSLLAKDGLIRCEVQPTDGRPVEHWFAVETTTETTCVV